MPSQRKTENNWLDVDPCFNALGTTDLIRRNRYKAFVDQADPTGELELIRGALQRGQLTGTSRFVDKIEHITGLRIIGRGQGRPAHKKLTLPAYDPIYPRREIANPDDQGYSLPKREDYRCG